MPLFPDAFLLFNQSQILDKNSCNGHWKMVITQKNQINTSQVDNICTLGTSDDAVVIEID